jgi:SNF2 family DNA or RNA helicase
MFVTPSKKLVMHVQDPLYFRNLMPDACRICAVPEGNLVVKHTIETTTLLRNLGFEVPSPVITHYPWPGKYRPFDHQYVMADAMTMHDKIFNLSEMGTGKSAATLWAADYLMSVGKVKRALIVAPLSTLNVVWKKDIFDILMHRTAVVVRGTAEQRTQRFGLDADFYIINHDAIRLDDVAKLIKRRKDIDLIIVDEASDFRNPSTTRYKYLRWAVEKKQRFWAITGTPNPNGPFDSWAMARIINPNGVPPHHGTFKRQTMIQVSQFKWAPKRGAEELVHAAMQPAVRFAKADCLDLPPVVTIKRQVAMTAAQTKAFAAMKEEMSLRWASGDVVNAVNAADQINKLRQILCGVVKDPDSDRYIPIDYAPRLAELRKLIAAAQAKVIIVVPFKGIIRLLEKDLVNAGHSVAVLNGDVSPRTREKIIHNFKTGTHPNELLCHPKVMSHGLNLVEADMTIFYAPIYSADQYRQVVERNNRTGQTRKMTVARMAAHPLEWQIYSAIDTRGITQDNILRLYQKVIA